VLLAPAVDLDLDFFGQLAAEVIYVNSGTAIDLGWILAGEQANSHGNFLQPDRLATQTRAGRLAGSRICGGVRLPADEGLIYRALAGGKTPPVRVRG
jgi:hypothetical protein